MMRLPVLVSTLILCALLVCEASGQDVPTAPAPDGPSVYHMARFGEGPGPVAGADGRIVLLDGSVPAQSNAVAFERAAEGATDRLTLTCRMRILDGGDGAAFLFLDTLTHGARGPAPFRRDWAEPNVKGAFAVGIDVHDPPTEEPFGPLGNYRGEPEREVSLHWDGREIVKRVTGQEFRGEWTDVRIDVNHVCGGAEVTVAVGEETVYDAYFVPRLHPYEARLAIGAGSRSDAATEFGVDRISLTPGAPAVKERPPLRFEVFHHVRTDGSRQSHTSDVDLPPVDWAFGRVLLTLDLHDAGDGWDEWDRNGHLFIWDGNGEKRDIVPFITSYRTECHWVVDVTHFRPWLAGKTRFEIAAGTNFYKNRGYLMSVSLAFCHGTPRHGISPAEPFAVIPLWYGTARHRGNEHFSGLFETRTLEIPESTIAARIATTTTGHSQVGEFTRSGRTIVVQPEGGEPAEFPNVLWKTDCYLNPNRPQSGTWKYSRAGWAPGDVVRPWWIDLSGYVVPGLSHAFEYVPEPYDLSQWPTNRRPPQKQLDQASHVIRSYLILYREPAGLTAAPVLRVVNVSQNSAAAKAGIKAGDYLAHYDGRPVDSVGDLSGAKKAATDAGKKTVEVVVFRGSERLTLTMATGQMGVNLSER